MGCIGYTEFCNNGHIVRTIKHDEVDYYDDILECPYCGSKKFARMLEWPDEDFIHNRDVPVEPIGYDVNASIPVYDVSKVQHLFSEIRTPGECKECYNYEFNCEECEVKITKSKEGYNWWDYRKGR